MIDGYMFTSLLVAGIFAVERINVRLQLVQHLGCLFAVLVSVQSALKYCTGPLCVLDTGAKLNLNCVEQVASAVCLNPLKLHECRAKVCLAFQY